MAASNRIQIGTLHLRSSSCHLYKPSHVGFKRSWSGRTIVVERPCVKKKLDPYSILLPANTESQIGWQARSRVDRTTRSGKCRYDCRQDPLDARRATQGCTSEQGRRAQRAPWATSSTGMAQSPLKPSVTPNADDLRRLFLNSAARPGSIIGMRASVTNDE